MARKHYRRTFSASERAAIAHVQAYNELTRRLGPIVPKMKEAFFQLNTSQLGRLFDLYEKTYGSKAGTYARAAYPKWKSGQTKMAGQTAERMINLVPRFLQTSQRFELVKELCLYHQRKIYRTVEIDKRNPTEAGTQAQAALQDLVTAAANEQIPNTVFDDIIWLTDSDAIVARKIVNDVQKVRAKHVADAVTSEWEKIMALATRSDTKKFSETFSFPNGSLTIRTKDVSKCFIATSAYGSADHPDVDLLRRYRDQKLKTTVFGRSIINTYEVAGPFLARAIDNKPKIRKVVRKLIKCTVVRYLEERHAKGRRRKESQ